MAPVQMPLETARKTLEEKVRSRQARVGIIGLGYVGLPLALEFGKACFSVTVIDVSADKTERISAGDSYIGDLSGSDVARLVDGGKLRATTDFSVVRGNTGVHGNGLLVLLAGAGSSGAGKFPRESLRWSSYWRTPFG